MHIDDDERPQSDPRHLGQFSPHQLDNALDLRVAPRHVHSQRSALYRLARVNSSPLATTRVQQFEILLMGMVYDDVVFQ